MAVEEGRILGHIAFSPVTIESGHQATAAIGLAAMAVSPEYQRAGIGSRLIEVGLEEIRKLGHNIVVVLGHPEYYPRFGFSPSRDFGIRWELEVPDEVFMVKELKEGALQKVKGVVKYRPEFNEV